MDFNKENYYKNYDTSAAFPKEAVKTQAQAPAAAPVEEVAPAATNTVYDPVKDNEIGEGTMPEIQEEVLAENDFDDILNILKKTNRRDDVRRR